MTDVSGWRKRQIEQSEMCSNYGGFCKKEWVGLTDEEQSFIYNQVKQIVDSKPFWVRFADAIEAKLKEKNT
jgi:hypothetical protein